MIKINKKQIINFFFPILIVVTLIFGIVSFPNESILAAKKGLSIWVNVLIPSLLPFIIGANLVVDLKVVDIIGYIINPITKFIFNVSGKSALVFVISTVSGYPVGAKLASELRNNNQISKFEGQRLVSFCSTSGGKSALVFVISTVSGYPVGAKLASELRNNNQISKFEGQRLVSFCSTSGPLFIVGSVATGMFKNPSLGYLMLICHYLGSISVGLLFRNYGKESLNNKKSSLKTNVLNTINNRYKDDRGFFVLFGSAVFNGVNTLLSIGGFVINKKSSLKTNVLNTINNRYKDDRGFFVLFGSAVFNGVNTLLSIGGFVIVFSVVSAVFNGVNTLLSIGGFVIVFSVVFEIFSLFNIISLISSILYVPLSLLGVTKELCHAFISGLFEITIGCDRISSVLSTPEVLRASLSSFLIGFSGLSILAQCCNFIAKTF